VASFDKVTFLFIIASVLMVVLVASINENLLLDSPMVKGIYDLGVTTLS
jgi:hypothetical protein